MTFTNPFGNSFSTANVQDLINSCSPTLIQEKVAEASRKLMEHINWPIWVTRWKAPTPATIPKATTPLSGSHSSPSIVLPAPKRLRSDPAVPPATDQWSYDTSPLVLSHDVSSHTSDLLQLPYAIWNDLGVSKAIDVSDRNPICDSDHVSSHVVLEDFPNDVFPRVTSAKSRLSKENTRLFLLLPSWALAL